MLDNPLQAKNTYLGLLFFYLSYVYLLILFLYIFYLFILSDCAILLREKGIFGYKALQGFRP